MLLSITSYSSFLCAQTLEELTVLVSPDGRAGDSFGSSVSISKDIVVIGARSRDDSTGRAYVYRQDSLNKENWLFEDSLLSVNLRPKDFFGNTVASDGEFIAIGAPGSNQNQGLVYIYERNILGEWREVFRLQESNVPFFGTSVDIHDNNIIVGAEGSSEVAGAAFIYNKLNNQTRWERVAILQDDNSNPNDRDFFGGAVSLSEDYAVVGATQKGSQGGIFIFFRNQLGANEWGLRIPREPDEIGFPNREDFGGSVSISDDILVVGAQRRNNNQGAVYFFERDRNNDGFDEWGDFIPNPLLLAENPQQGALFGASVSVSETIAVVGSPNEEDLRGVAYVYFNNESDNIEQVVRLKSRTSKENDILGTNVSVSGDYIVIGAPGSDTLGDNSGAAYVFLTGLPTPNIYEEDTLILCINNDAFFLTNCVPGNEYQWFPEDNGIIASLTSLDTNSIAIQAIDTGFTTLILREQTFSTNRIAYDTLVIQVTPLPVIDLGAVPDTICTNQLPITLSATPPGGKFFLGTDSLPNAIIPNGRIQGGTQVIIYEFEDQNGCVNRDTTEIESIYVPNSVSIAPPSGTNLLCSGTELELEAVPNPLDAEPMQYYWFKQEDNFLTGPIDSGKVISVTEPGRYVTKAFTSFCDTVISDTFEVVLIDFFLPTVFTPNGDGINDVFRLRSVNRDNIIGVDWQIFNRNKKLVFSASNREQALEGWNGGDYPSGTYYYRVIVHFSNCSSSPRTGKVSLIRSFD